MKFTIVLALLVVCAVTVQCCTVDSDCNHLNCAVGQDPFCHGNHCHCGGAHICTDDSDCHGHCNAGGSPTCDDQGHCHCN